MIQEHEWDDFFKLSDEFYRRFGDRIPLMQLDHETFEGIKKSVQRCFDEDKDLLDEIYGWDYENNIY